MCLVFETLGKSLYDFIKDNGYKGFSLQLIRSIAIQSLKALAFLHSHGLTHTDLKPENILLKSNAYDEIRDRTLWPLQVINKRAIFGSQKCDSPSEEEDEGDE